GCLYRRTCERQYCRQYIPTFAPFHEHLQLLIFKSEGSRGIDVALELTNCPVGTSRVTASFSGAADSTGYYKNQGTAQNIQLELQDDSGNTLNSGATKTVQVDDSSQSAHFPLQVRALTVNGGATQGTIQAVIRITYTYS
ncbi:fimbrial protein, partial [Escherichia coli]